MNNVCQLCHQAKATVHVTDTVPEKKERHLCEECAEREGIIVRQHHSTNEILQQFLKHKVALSSPGEDAACPQCGMTFREFQVKGLLGCPNDYVAFQALLNPLIERAHEGATRHIGKTPCTAEQAVQKHTRLSRLHQELKAAVEGESYEKAASLRDEIRSLESA